MKHHIKLTRLMSSYMFWFSQGSDEGDDFDQGKKGYEEQFERQGGRHRKGERELRSSQPDEESPNPGSQGQIEGGYAEFEGEMPPDDIGNAAGECFVGDPFQKIPFGKMMLAASKFKAAHMKGKGASKLGEEEIEELVQLLTQNMSFKSETERKQYEAKLREELSGKTLSEVEIEHQIQLIVQNMTFKDEAERDAFKAKLRAKFRDKQFSEEEIEQHVQTIMKNMTFKDEVERSEFEAKLRAKFRGKKMLSEEEIEHQVQLAMQTMNFKDETERAQFEAMIRANFRGKQPSEEEIEQQVQIIMRNMTFKSETERNAFEAKLKEELRNNGFLTYDENGAVVFSSLPKKTKIVKKKKTVVKKIVKKSKEETESEALKAAKYGY